MAPPPKHASDARRTALCTAGAGLVLLACAAYYALGVWQLQHKLLDDGYIVFRLAENLAAGHGIVWNPGGEPTESCTSFLYPFAMAALVRLGASPFASNLALSAASALAVVGLAFATLRRGLARHTVAGAAVLGSYLLDVKAVIRGSVSGLETAFFSFVVLFAWHAALRLVERPGRGRAAVLGLACFAAVLGRPTGALFAAALLAVLAARSVFGRSRSAQGREAVLLAGAIFSVCGLAFAAFKLSYFGYLLPNSFHLKGRDVSSLGAPTALEYLGRVIVPFMPLCAVALAAGWRRILDALRDPATCTRALVTALPPLAFLVYYGWFADVPHAAYRYFVPVHAFVLVGVAALLVPLHGARPTVAALGVIAALGGLVYAAAASYGFGLTWPATVKPPSRLVAHMERFGRELGATRLGTRAALINDSAGALPWASGFRHVDRTGLADNFLSGRDDPTPQEREAYIWSQNADVYLGFEPQASPNVERVEDEPLMQTRYVRRSLLGRDKSEVDRRTFGGSPEITHLRMRELRDRWHLVGLLEDSAYWESYWKLWLFAYVRRDSPHFDELVGALEDSIDCEAHEIDLDASLSEAPLPAAMTEEAQARLRLRAKSADDSD